MISTQIQTIIKNRNSRVSSITSNMETILRIKEELNQLNRLKSDIIQKNPKYKNTFDILSIDAFNSRFAELQNQYEELVARFSRKDINITIVGRARQGKSKLLQSISGLDDKVIPAFISTDCTGAVSTIKNSNLGFKATIVFFSEREMIDIVQKYIDDIIGKNQVTIGSTYDIQNLDLQMVESKIEVGSPKRAEFTHLSKYVQHFNEWYTDDFKNGSLELTNPNRVVQYVAQHNGENDKRFRIEYYSYLAVKEANIECSFNYPECGQIVLRDTIGLGDTAIGIDTAMLKTISKDSDATIIVRRPECSTGTFENDDVEMYKLIYDSLKDKGMDKWLFWLTNHTTKDSPYLDNIDVCTRFNDTVISQRWDIAKNFIVDVSNTSDVTNNLLKPMLEILIKNLPEIDSILIKQLDVSSLQLYDELQAIKDSLNEILKSSYNLTDLDDWFNDRFDNFKDTKLLGSLKKLRDSQYKCNSVVCEDFYTAVNIVLSNANSLIPSQESILNDILKGGNNRPIEKYRDYTDNIRTSLTQAIISTDRTLDIIVDSFKKEIATRLFSKDYGRLEYIFSGEAISKDSIRRLYQYLEKRSEEHRSEDYTQLINALKLLDSFKISVRGFLMHRIRLCLDKLDIDKTSPTLHEKGINYERQAKEIHYCLTIAISDIVNELKRKLDGLYGDPNMLIYAMCVEFYDQVSYPKEIVQKEWRTLYRKHMTEIWHDECSVMKRESELLSKLDAVYKQLKAIDRETFTWNF